MQQRFLPLSSSASGYDEIVQFWTLRRSLARFDLRQVLLHVTVRSGITPGDCIPADAAAAGAESTQQSILAPGVIPLPASAHPSASTTQVHGSGGSTPVAAAAGPHSAASAHPAKKKKSKQFQRAERQRLKRQKLKRQKLQKLHQQTDNDQAAEPSPAATSGQSQEEGGVRLGRLVMSSDGDVPSVSQAADGATDSATADAGDALEYLDDEIFRPRLESLYPRSTLEHFASLAVGGRSAPSLLAPSSSLRPAARSNTSTRDASGRSGRGSGSSLGFGGGSGSGGSYESDLADAAANGDSETFYDEDTPVAEAHPCYVPLVRGDTGDVVGRVTIALQRVCQFTEKAFADRRFVHALVMHDELCGFVTRVQHPYFEHRFSAQLNHLQSLAANAEQLMSAELTDARERYLAAKRFLVAHNRSPYELLLERDAAPSDAAHRAASATKPTIQQRKKFLNSVGERLRQRLQDKALSPTDKIELLLRALYIACEESSSMRSEVVSDIMNTAMICLDDMLLYPPYDGNVEWRLALVSHVCDACFLLESHPSVGLNPSFCAYALYQLTRVNYFCFREPEAFHHARQCTLLYEHVAALEKATAAAAASGGSPQSSLAPPSHTAAPSTSIASTAAAAASAAGTAAGGDWKDGTVDSPLYNASASGLARMDRALMQQYEREREQRVNASGVAHSSPSSPSRSPLASLSTGDSNSQNFSRLDEHRRLCAVAFCKSVLPELHGAVDECFRAADVFRNAGDWLSYTFVRAHLLERRHASVYSSQTSASPSASMLPGGGGGGRALSSIQRPPSPPAELDAAKKKALSNTFYSSLTLEPELSNLDAAIQSLRLHVDSLTCSPESQARVKSRVEVFSNRCEARLKQLRALVISNVESKDAIVPRRRHKNRGAGKSNPTSAGANSASSSATAPTRPLFDFAPTELESKVSSDLDEEAKTATFEVDSPPSDPTGDNAVCGLLYAALKLAPTELEKDGDVYLTDMAHASIVFDIGRHLSSWPELIPFDVPSFVQETYSSDDESDDEDAAERAAIAKFERAARAERCFVEAKRRFKLATRRAVSRIERDIPALFQRELIDSFTDWCEQHVRRVEDCRFRLLGDVRGLVDDLCNYLFANEITDDSDNSSATPLATDSAFGSTLWQLRQFVGDAAGEHAVPPGGSHFSAALLAAQITGGGASSATGGGNDTGATSSPLGSPTPVGCTMPFDIMFAPNTAHALLDGDDHLVRYWHLRNWTEAPVSVLRSVYRVFYALDKVLLSKGDFKYSRVVMSMWEMFRVVLQSSPNCESDRELSVMTALTRLSIAQCEFIQSGELPDVDIMIDDIGMLSDRLASQESPGPFDEVVLLEALLDAFGTLLDCDRHFSIFEDDVFPKKEIEMLEANLEVARDTAARLKSAYHEVRCLCRLATLFVIKQRLFNDPPLDTATPFATPPKAPILCQEAIERVMLFQRAHRSASASAAASSGSAPPPSASAPASASATIGNPHLDRAQRLFAVPQKFMNDYHKKYTLAAEFELAKAETWLVQLEDPAGRARQRLSEYDWHRHDNDDTFDGASRHSRDKSTHQSRSAQLEREMDESERKRDHARDEDVEIHVLVALYSANRFAQPLDEAGTPSFWYLRMAMAIARGVLAVHRRRWARYHHRMRQHSAATATEVAETPAQPLGVFVLGADTTGEWQLICAHLKRALDVIMKEHSFVTQHDDLRSSFAAVSEFFEDEWSEHFTDVHTMAKDVEQRNLTLADRHVHSLEELTFVLWSAVHKRAPGTFRRGDTDLANIDFVTRRMTSLCENVLVARHAASAMACELYRLWNDGVFGTNDYDSRDEDEEVQLASSMVPLLLKAGELHLGMDDGGEALDMLSRAVNLLENASNDYPPSHPMSHLYYEALLLHARSIAAVPQVIFDNTLNIDDVGLSIDFDKCFRDAERKFHALPPTEFEYFGPKLHVTWAMSLLERARLTDEELTADLLIKVKRRLTVVDEILKDRAQEWQKKYPKVYAQYLLVLLTVLQMLPEARESAYTLAHFVEFAMTALRLVRAHFGAHSPLNVQAMALLCGFLEERDSPQDSPRAYFFAHAALDLARCVLVPADPRISQARELLAHMTAITASRQLRFLIDLLERLATRELPLRPTDVSLMGAFDVREDRPASLPTAILSDQLLTDTLYYEASKQCLDAGRAYKQELEERRRAKEQQQRLAAQRKQAAAARAKANAARLAKRKGEAGLGVGVGVGVGIGGAAGSRQSPDLVSQWEQQQAREVEELRQHAANNNGRKSNKKRKADSGAVATLEVASPFEFPRDIRPTSGELKSPGDADGGVAGVGSQELEINLSQEEIRELFGSEGYEPKSIVEAMRDIVARMDSQDGGGLELAQHGVPEGESEAEEDAYDGDGSNSVVNLRSGAEYRLGATHNGTRRSVSRTRSQSAPTSLPSTRRASKSGASGQLAQQQQQQQRAVAQQRGTANEKDRSASPPPIALSQRRHRRQSTADHSDAAATRSRGRHLTSVQRTDEIMRQQRREADKRRERRQRDRDRQQRRGANRSARDKTADTLANFRAAARSLASARGGANGTPEEGRVLDQFLATDLDDADLERRFAEAIQDTPTFTFDHKSPDGGASLSMNGDDTADGNNARQQPPLQQQQSHSPPQRASVSASSPHNLDQPHDMHVHDAMPEDALAMHSSVLGGATSLSILQHLVQDSGDEKSREFKSTHVARLLLSPHWNWSRQDDDLVCELVRVFHRYCDGMVAQFDYPRARITLTELDRFLSLSCGNRRFLKPLIAKTREMLGSIYYDTADIHRIYSLAKQCHVLSQYDPECRELGVSITQMSQFLFDLDPLNSLSRDDQREMFKHVRSWLCHAQAIFERWSATLGGQLGLVLVHLGYAMCQISPPFFGAVTHSQWVKFKEDLNAWGDFIESKDKSRKDVHRVHVAYLIVRAKFFMMRHEFVDAARELRICVAEVDALFGSPHPRGALPRLLLAEATASQLYHRHSTQFPYPVQPQPELLHTFQATMRELDVLVPQFFGADHSFTAHFNELRSIEASKFQNLILKTSVPEVELELNRGMQRVRDLLEVILPLDVPTAANQMMGVPLPRRLVDPRPIELVPNRFPKIYAYLDDHVTMVPPPTADPDTDFKTYEVEATNWNVSVWQQLTNVLISLATEMLFRLSVKHVKALMDFSQQIIDRLLAREQLQYEYVNTLFPEISQFLDRYDNNKGLPRIFFPLAIRHVEAVYLPLGDRDMAYEWVHDNGPSRDSPEYPKWCLVEVWSITLALRGWNDWNPGPRQSGDAAYLTESRKFEERIKNTLSEVEAYYMEANDHVGLVKAYHARAHFELKLMRPMFFARARVAIEKAAELMEYDKMVPEQHTLIHVRHQMLRAYLLMKTGNASSAITCIQFCVDTLSMMHPATDPQLLEYLLYGAQCHYMCENTDWKMVREYLKRANLIAKGHGLSGESVYEVIRYLSSECDRQTERKTKSAKPYRDTDNFTKLMTLVRGRTQPKIRSHIDELMAVKYTASGGSGDRAGGVDYETYEGQTAMLMACRMGDIRIVEHLLNADARVDYINRRAETPLSHAVYSGNLELVELLISRGASVLNCGHPLNAAAQINHVDIAQCLLDHGACPNEVKIWENDKHSALTTACGNGFSEMVRLLLEKKANPNDPGTNYPALFQCFHHLSRNNFSTDPIKLLLDNGADLTKKWNDKSIFEIAFLEVFSLSQRIDATVGKMRGNSASAAPQANGTGSGGSGGNASAAASAGNASASSGGSGAIASLAAAAAVKDNKKSSTKNPKSLTDLKKLFDVTLKNAAKCAMILASNGADQSMFFDIFRPHHQMMQQHQHPFDNTFQFDLDLKTDDPLDMHEDASSDSLSRDAKSLWRTAGPSGKQVIEKLEQAFRVGQATWVRREEERKSRSAKRKLKRNRQKANRAMHATLKLKKEHQTLMEQSELLQEKLREQEAIIDRTKNHAKRTNIHEKLKAKRDAKQQLVHASSSTSSPSSRRHDGGDALPGTTTTSTAQQTLQATTPTSAAPPVRSESAPPTDRSPSLNGGGSRRSARRKKPRSAAAAASAEDSFDSSSLSSPSRPVENEQRSLSPSLSAGSISAAAGVAAPYDDAYRSHVRDHFDDPTWELPHPFDGTEALEDISEDEGSALLDDEYDDEDEDEEDEALAAHRADLDLEQTRNDLVAQEEAARIRRRELIQTILAEKEVEEERAANKKAKRRQKRLAKKQQRAAKKKKTRAGRTKKKPSRDHAVDTEQRRRMSQDDCGDAAAAALVGLAAESEKADAEASVVAEAAKSREKKKDAGSLLSSKTVKRKSLKGAKTEGAKNAVAEEVEVPQEGKAKRVKTKSEKTSKTAKAGKKDSKEDVAKGKTSSKANGAVEKVNDEKPSNEAEEAKPSRSRSLSKTSDASAQSTESKSTSSSSSATAEVRKMKSKSKLRAERRKRASAYSTSMAEKEKDAAAAAAEEKPSDAAASHFLSGETSVDASDVPVLAPQREVMPVKQRHEFYMYKFHTRSCPRAKRCANKSCEFAHGNDEVRRCPVKNALADDLELLYSADICTKAKTYHDCPQGDKCQKSHSAQRERDFHPAIYKTQLCSYYSRPNKSCRAGAHCHFAHGQDEVRTPPPFALLPPRKDNPWQKSPRILPLPTHAAAATSVPSLKKTAAGTAAGARGVSALLPPKKATATDHRRAQRHQKSQSSSAAGSGKMPSAMTARGRPRHASVESSSATRRAAKPPLVRPAAGGLSEKDHHFFMFEFRTQMCTNERCLKDDMTKCAKAHTKSGLRRQPRVFADASGHYYWSYSQDSCDTGNLHECPRGNACPYAHTLQQESFFHPLVYKTELCKSRHTNGICERFNRFCSRAGADDEFRSPLTAAEAVALGIRSVDYHAGAGRPGAGPSSRQSVPLTASSSKKEWRIRSHGGNKHRAAAPPHRGGKSGHTVPYASPPSYAASVSNSVRPSANSVRLQPSPLGLAPQTHPSQSPSLIPHGIPSTTFQDLPPLTQQEHHTSTSNRSPSRVSSEHESVTSVASSTDFDRGGGLGSSSRKTVTKLGDYVAAPRAASRSKRKAKANAVKAAPPAVAPSSTPAAAQGAPPTKPPPLPTPVEGEPLPPTREHSSSPPQPFSVPDVDPRGDFYQYPARTTEEAPPSFRHASSSVSTVGPPAPGTENDSGADHVARILLDDMRVSPPPTLMSFLSSPPRTPHNARSSHNDDRVLPLSFPEPGSDEPHPPVGMHAAAWEESNNQFFTAAQNPPPPAATAVGDYPRTHPHMSHDSGETTDKPAEDADPDVLISARDGLIRTAHLAEPRRPSQFRPVGFERGNEQQKAHSQEYRRDEDLFDFLYADRIINRNPFALHPAPAAFGGSPTSDVVSSFGSSGRSVPLSREPSALTAFGDESLRRPAVAAASSSSMHDDGIPRAASTLQRPPDLVASPIQGHPNGHPTVADELKQDPVLLAFSDSPRGQSLAEGLIGGLLGEDDDVRNVPSRAHVGSALLRAPNGPSSFGNPIANNTRPPPSVNDDDGQRRPRRFLPTRRRLQLDDEDDANADQRSVSARSHTPSSSTTDGFSRTALFADSSVWSNNASSPAPSPAPSSASSKSATTAGASGAPPPINANPPRHAGSSSVFNFGRHPTPGGSRTRQHSHSQAASSRGGALNAPRQRAASSMQMPPPHQGGGLLPHPGAYPRHPPAAHQYGPPPPQYYPYGGPPQVPSHHPQAIINPALLQQQPPLPSEDDAPASVAGSNGNNMSDTHGLQGGGSGGLLSHPPNGVPYFYAQQQQQPQQGPPSTMFGAPPSHPMSSPNPNGVDDGVLHSAFRVPGSLAAQKPGGLFAGPNWNDAFFTVPPSAASVAASDRKENNSATTTAAPTQVNMFVTQYGDQNAKQSSDNRPNDGGGFPPQQQQHG